MFRELARCPGCLHFLIFSTSSALFKFVFIARQTNFKDKEMNQTAHSISSSVQVNSIFNSGWQTLPFPGEGIERAWGEQKMGRSRERWVIKGRGGRDSFSTPPPPSARNELEHTTIQNTWSSVCSTMRMHVLAAAVSRSNRGYKSASLENTDWNPRLNRG